MKPTILFSIAAIVGLALAGCGGGGGGGGDEASGNAFIQSVSAVINSSNPDTSEPQAVESINTAQDDTSEPVAIDI